MKDLSQLSIATTIHNNLERWLEMAHSFEEHVGIPAEFVVVDDASIIPAKIYGLRAPIRLVRNELARGFCGASDQALRKVVTSFALLVDADITFFPGDFMGAYEIFSRDSRLAWCNFQQITGMGNPGCSWESQLLPPSVFALGNQAQNFWLKFHPLPPLRPESGGRIAYVPISHSSCALVQMEAFYKIKGFDLRYWQCMSDNDLCWRLGKAGYIVGVDTQYTVRHDGAGGKAGGEKRITDLYFGTLLFYETHFPSSSFYLRPLLAVRHFLEVPVIGLLKLAGRNSNSCGFRWRLGLLSLKGYRSKVTERKRLLKSGLT